jgi:hypothetical protein
MAGGLALKSGERGEWWDLRVGGWLTTAEPEVGRESGWYWDCMEDGKGLWFIVGMSFSRCRESSISCILPLESLVYFKLVDARLVFSVM